MKVAILGLASMFLMANLVSPLVLAKRNVNFLSGPSAKGKFEIRAVDGSPARDIEFSAQTNGDGSLIGEAVFKDTLTTEGSAGEASTGTGEKPLYLKADLDCLVVKSNKAIMSGSITHSSLEPYLGRRILLVAQDNGGSEDPRARDKVTWGVYRLLTNNWPAKDAERSDEEISPLTWISTDAERPEDEGTPFEKNEVVGCQTFPLSSFSFLDTAQGRGTVRIRP